jgi:hypothetical protein
MNNFSRRGFFGGLGATLVALVLPGRAKTKDKKEHPIYKFNTTIVLPRPDLAGQEFIIPVDFGQGPPPWPILGYHDKRFPDVSPGDRLICESGEQWVPLTSDDRSHIFQQPWSSLSCAKSTTHILVSSISQPDKGKCLIPLDKVEAVNPPKRLV